jgi:hypothetical protein
LVELVNRGIVGGGLLSGLLGNIESVLLRPAAAQEPPYAAIGKGGWLLSRHPSIVVTPPENMRGHFEVITGRIADAGLTGGEPRKSMGIVVYDFPAGTGGAHLVVFAIEAMRALGAMPKENEWEYQTVRESSA